MSGHRPRQCSPDSKSDVQTVALDGFRLTLGHMNRGLVLLTGVSSIKLLVEVLGAFVLNFDDA